MMNSRSMMNRPQQQQQQQGGLRNDCQSVVQGIQSMMQISYSGVQLVIFGSLLAEKTKKLIEFIKSGTVSIATKLLTLFRIKQILKGELSIAAPVQGSIIKVFRFLLIVVIVLIGALLQHMRNKIKEKKLLEQMINEQQEQSQISEEVIESNQNDNNASIQQNDFWNHPIEESTTTTKEPQPSSIPQINYLNDLPGFSTAQNNKPWMK